MEDPTRVGLLKPAGGPSLAVGAQLSAPGWTWPLADGASAMEKD